MTKFNRNILFISGSEIHESHPAYQAIDALGHALVANGLTVHLAESPAEATTFITQSPIYSGVGIFWDYNNPAMVIEAETFIKALRTRSETTPIFLLSEKNVTDQVPIKVLQAAQEYVYLFSETPDFIANRILRAVTHYYDQLLPPYFKTLKEFTEDGDYYWDCPGHMGGMAYLKHPVGVEFFNFYGENMLRSDIGVATAEMGDYLIHEGPPKKSEEIAAERFGADWTFYGVGGSSTSNRIVAQGAVGADEMVLVDRNCHKSLNHALTLSQGRPVYLKPTRNGYGLIGPIPTKRLKTAHITDLISHSELSKDAVSKIPSYAVVTNCTYDGFCYNVKDVVTHLGESVPRIHFDEAWYAYAKFHPLYKERFAMDVPDDLPNRPTIFAVQSTHKMLPALSMASMIHVKKSDRATLNFENFNDAFMMHGTTSPYYPIIASIDVAVSMMGGNSGPSLVQESIEESIDFRKAVVSLKRRLKEENGNDEWFFDVLQPTEVKCPQSGKSFSFEDAPMSLLSQEPSCWTLNAGDQWHGFKDEDLEETDSMLDPIKVSITCPGITPQGEYEEYGIPGYVMTLFLDDRRIEIARTGDYTLLILFSVGTTKGKWGTLIETLLDFKNLYDNGAKAVDAIPSLKDVSPIYETMTLKELCQKMHTAMKDSNMMSHINDAVNADPIPAMSPAEAFQKVVRNHTEPVKLQDFRGRISATMVTPYPPGIPVLMPGERLAKDDTGVIGYLEALQAFGENFPGFEHELQGVHIDEQGDYWVRAILEEGQIPQNQNMKFIPRVSNAVKKARA